MHSDPSHPRGRLRRLAREKGMLDVDTGSVTFVQRYGGGLNLNPHYHLIGLDGWFVHNEEGALKFQDAPAPNQRDVERLSTFTRVSCACSRSAVSCISTRTTRW